MFFKVGNEGCGSVAEILLEGFCEFARDTDTAAGADGIEGGKCFEYSVRGLKVDACFTSLGCGLEFVGTTTTFHRQETSEKKTVAWKARTNERGENGRGTGKHADGQATFDTSPDESIAGIRYAWHASICDECNVCASGDAVCDILATKGFVVTVEAEEWFFYTKMLQEKSAVPSILRRDEIGGIQDIQGT